MGRPKATEHGTYAYAHANRCPCEPCRTAERRWVKAYKLDRARGVTRRVNAEPARRKIQHFLDSGARPNQIQQAVGFHDSVMAHLMGGTRGRPPAELIERGTAAKIARVTLEQVLAIPTMHDSIGIRRRIQALQYRGHAPSTLAAALGVSVAQLYQYMWSEQCYTKTIESVHRVYLELRDQQGTSGHARWKAWREGWAGPWQWDDEDLDNPEAKPHPGRCIVSTCGREAGTAHNLCPTHLRRVHEMGGFTEGKRYKVCVERLERRKIVDGKRRRANVRELFEMGGMSDYEIAAQVGVTEDYVRELRAEDAA